MVIEPNRNSVIYVMTDRLSFLFEKHFHNILNSYEIHKTTAGCNPTLAIT